ncbi:MAG: PA14 domain-containing protein [Planctomycetota bacterium]|nr:PA14 domain-containing protein [Planctomycetota bacterium]
MTDRKLDSEILSFKRWMLLPFTIFRRFIHALLSLGGDSNSRGKNRQISIECFESRSMMAAVTFAGTGLTGQYYDNADLSNLKVTRVDPTVDFSWGASSPDASIGVDTFSVRWAGQIEARFTETYTFYVNADDGAKLWINGQLLVNRFDTVPVANASGAISLIAGRKYDVRVEYFDQTAAASVRLEWSSASQPRQIIPTSQLFPTELGSISREVFAGINGSTIASLTSASAFPNSPTSYDSIASFQSPSNFGDQYGERLRGFLLPPVSGFYTFAIAGDLSSELWLSNSDDVSLKQRIAFSTTSTDPLNWTQNASQTSTPIFLSVGQKYYIEALHKEDTGSDHLAVGWTRPGSSITEIIPGEFLLPILAKVSLFSESPSTAEGGGTPANFTVVRSGAPLNQALTVRYTTRGTATNGVDYTTLPGSITIPAGQSSATLNIHPLSDAIVEGTESIIIELQDGTGYEVDNISQRTGNGSLQDDVAAPAGGLSMIAGSTLANFTNRFGGTFTTVSDPVQGSVIQAAITTQPASQFSAQMRQPTTAPLAVGDVILAEFYVRALNTPGNITVVLELGTAPNTKALSNGMIVPTSWMKVQIPFVSTEAFATGTANFAFVLGQQVQTIQFSNVRLINYGPDPNILPANGLSLSNIGGTYGTMETIAVAGQPFTSARRITTITPPANNEAWRLQGVVRNTAAIAINETVTYSFRLRANSGTTPRVQVNLQEAFGTFVTLQTRTLNPSTTWSSVYTYTFTSTTRAYAANELQFVFNLGYPNQSIEIGDITWAKAGGTSFSSLPQRLPAASYGGRSGTSSWRDSADTRIDTMRTADLNITVMDASGQMVNDALVTVRQQKQAFKFGTAVNGSTGLLSNTNDVESQQYQALVKRLFNTAVIENDLKWPQFISNRQRGIDAANWVVNNGLYLRGHNVVWPSRKFMPASVWTQYDSTLASSGAAAAATGLRNTINARIIDAASTFKGIAGEWDIVNEPFANKDVMTILGNDEVLAWYQLFRQQDPTALRVLNDYDIFASNGGNTAHRTNYEYWLGRLKAANLLEGMGEQSHYREGNFTDIATLGNLLQYYNSTFNLPIAITEFDVNTKDEQLQADYLRDYMKMSFSQSGVNQFLHWGFWSKSHWLPDAALYRDDFSIKPNGQAYEDLVFGDWWTDTRGTTRLGAYVPRVFQGDYDVIVTRGSQTFTAKATVGANGSTLNITLPGLVVTLPSQPLREGGPGQNVGVALTVAPSANVTVTLASNSNWISSVSTLTFTTANWNVPQSILLTAVNDQVAEGDHVVQASLSSSSTDPQYNLANATLVSIAIRDPFSTIVSRNVYYRSSFFDTTANSQSAIDPTKSALLPGGTASIANYTNYSRGINGIIVDLTNAASLAAIDSMQRV